MIAKLCYLFNYPLQSLACVISEIAKKDGGAVEAIVPQSGEVKEEVKIEEPKIEEVKAEEVKTEETPAEEAKVEETPAAE